MQSADLTSAGTNRDRTWSAVGPSPFVRSCGKEPIMPTSGKRHRHSGAHRRLRPATGAKESGSINGVKHAVIDGAGKIKAALSEATGEVLESLGNVRDAAATGARERFNTVRESAGD